MPPIETAERPFECVVEPPIERVVERPSIAFRYLSGAPYEPVLHWRHGGLMFTPLMRNRTLPRRLLGEIAWAADNGCFKQRARGSARPLSRVPRPLARLPLDLPVRRRARCPLRRGSDVGTLTGCAAADTRAWLPGGARHSERHRALAAHRRPVGRAGRGLHRRRHGLQGEPGGATGGDRGATAWQAHPYRTAQLWPRGAGRL